MAVPARASLPQPRGADPDGSPGPPVAAASVPGAEGSTPSGPGSTGSTQSGTAPERAGLSLRELAAYSSTLFGLLCLIKVYGVARYSTTTTATLVTTAPERVILGTLAIYVYPTMAALTYGIPWFCLAWRRRVRPEAWPLLAAVVLVTGLMTPVPYHLAGLGLVGTSVLVELLLRRRGVARLCRWLRLPGELPARLRGSSLALLGGLALLVGFLDTLESPWMSAELFVLNGPVVTTTQQPDGSSAGRHVAVVSSADTVAGYPIEEGPSDFVILNAGTRYVMHVPKGMIRNRYTCHEAGTQLRGQVPLLDRLLGRQYTSPNSDCGAVRDQFLRLPENQPTTRSDPSRPTTG